MNENDSEHSNYMDLTTDSENYKKLDWPPRNFGKKDNLRSILEIPTKFQCIFKFPFFNIIQSRILDDVLYSDVPFVISAPTGSGKTVIFELAIIRLLMDFQVTNFTGDYKIIYVAPVKSLCSERLTDWHLKFSKIGLSCIVITGDSDNVSYKMLEKYHIIITTPEKWDSLTRNIQENPIIKEVKLFMIDEVHLLNEETRGPILEAIVSRMKIFRKNNPVRFIAVSATIPNIEDIADWLGNSGGKPAIYFKIGDELRPVKLKKVVLGYSCKPGTTAFKFDLNLNYKLQSIIMQYSEGKPTMIFCSTRKGVELTAKHISQEVTFHLTAEQKIILRNCAQNLLDNKMKSQLINGVGSHHAGMDAQNRTLIEELFRAGHLPVLATTSTLAMGVNLPAHLVIIKSTERYVNGEILSYTESNLLQMIGRAGRPQFDTHATVVIMTKEWQKHQYEKFLGGTELIESNLHRHLTQHLNAEVVLGVITDIAIALEWIRHTYLYVRALKNPKYYNIAANTKDKIEKRLQDICQIEINALHRYGMLQIDQLDGFSVSPTNIGNLMATYYLHLETMKLFAEVKGQETLAEILTVITKCKEFSETLLRTNDKKTLNTLNKCKFQHTIRFPLKGIIKTTDMKVNCVIQAILGCLKIQNPSLLQESWKIMRTGKSIAKCLVEYLRNKKKYFPALHNALILSQCFHTKLWENSPYVSRQLPKIGPVLSSMLATAGKTTFKTILETNPRNLEMIINRAAPMGNEILELVTSLPFYSIELIPPETNTTFNVKLVLTLLNADSVNTNCTLGIGTFMTLLVGDSQNNILVDKRIFHNTMVTCKEYVHYIEVVIQNDHIITAYLISQNWVGIDIKKTVEIKISNSIQSNSLNISSKEIATPVKRTEKQPEIRTANSSSITSYFKQVKTPNISSNEKKLESNVKKTPASVNKNVMKSITTYFPKQSEPENNEQSKKKFSFGPKHIQQNGQKAITAGENKQKLPTVRNPPLFSETALIPNSFELDYGTSRTLQPLPDDNNTLSQESSFYPSNIADIFQNIDDSICTESRQTNMATSSSNSAANENNLNEDLTQISTQKTENYFTKFFNKTTASQKRRLTSPISKKEKFLSSLKQSEEKNRKQKAQELLSQFTSGENKKLKKPQLSTIQKPPLFSETNLIHNSLESGYGTYGTPSDFNYNLSQVSTFYPPNIADIFKDVDESIYCESSQINMTPSSFNTQTNENNLNKILTQISTQKNENCLTKCFNKTTASQKQILTSHISKKHFLSSLKQSVKIEPKKEVQEHLSQFNYTPRKKINHTEVKKPRFLEYNGNIFEPEISITVDENNRPEICDKLSYTANPNKKIHNFDEEFYGQQNIVPNKKIVEKNEDQENSDPIEDINKPEEEEEFVKIPKLADSFRDYVMKTVQKLKAETSVNEEDNFDIGIEEFLLAPLNDSYSDSSTSEEEEEVIKDRMTTIIPKNKSKEQKNETTQLPNIISSPSFNATNNFEDDLIFDHSLYKDYSFAKLDQSMGDSQNLPPTSFNITNNFNLDTSLYNNFDKESCPKQLNIFENNNSLSSSINLSFLPESRAEYQANAAIDNSLTFPSSFEKPSHDLFFNLYSAEFKNMECSENSTDNSDNEAKRELKIKNTFKIVEQCNSAQGYISNQDEIDITFDLPSNRPIKKMKLTNASKFTGIKNRKSNRKDKLDSPPYHDFEKLKQLKKLISNYNENRLTSSKKKTQKYHSNTCKQSAIIETNTFSFCNQDKNSTEKSFTFFEKEQKISQKNQKAINDPFLKQFQNDKKDENKQKNCTSNPYSNPYFRH